MAPCGPSAFLATKKASFGKKTCRLAILLIAGPKVADFSKNIVLFYFTFVGQKGVFWVEKRCFGVFWTECEVADLEQRKEITTMDHRNKIQSLVLPIYDPGDAPDCITEYGPSVYEHGHICHKSAKFSNFGFPLNPSCI